MWSVRASGSEFSARSRRDGEQVRTQVPQPGPLLRRSTGLAQQGSEKSPPETGYWFIALLCHKRDHPGGQGL